MRPAGGECCSAVPVAFGWWVAEQIGLVAGVQTGAGDELGQLIVPVRTADLLEGDHVRGQPAHLLVQQPGAARVTLVVLHVEGQDPEAHRPVTARG